MWKKFLLSTSMPENLAKVRSSSQSFLVMVKADVWLVMVRIDVSRRRLVRVSLEEGMWGIFFGVIFANISIADI